MSGTHAPPALSRNPTHRSPAGQFGLSGSQSSRHTYVFVVWLPAQTPLSHSLPELQGSPLALVAPPPTGAPGRQAPPEPCRGAQLNIGGQLGALGLHERRQR